jgi:hypothetical protein
MNDRSCRGALCVVLLTSLLRTVCAEAAEPVSVEPQDDKARAALLFKEALEDYDHGLVTVAIDKLRLAYAASPNPKVLYNLAQFQEAAGQRAAAFATFGEYLSLGSAVLPPGRDRAVRSKLAELLRGLSTLKVETQPGDALLLLDGVPLAGSAVIDPGVHELVATAPGYRSLTLRVEAEAGSPLHVVVSLPEEERAPEPAFAAPAPAGLQAALSRPAPSRKGRGVTPGEQPRRAQIWGPALLGAGVALAAGAVVSYVVSHGQESRWMAEDRRLNAIAFEQRDDAYWQARAANAERSRNIRRLEGFELGLIVGASMLSAAGIGVWVTSPSNRRVAVAGLTYAGAW